eukprot:scaffold173516_cov27-Tisochrysis_lutea.AAC.5
MPSTADIRSASGPDGQDRLPRRERSGSHPALAMDPPSTRLDRCLRQPPPILLREAPLRAPTPLLVPQQLPPRQRRPPAWPQGNVRPRHS